MEDDKIHSVWVNQQAREHLEEIEDEEQEPFDYATPASWELG